MTVPIRVIKTPASLCTESKTTFAQPCPVVLNVTLGGPEHPAWSYNWSLNKNQGHSFLRGWSRPKKGRSCSLELSSPAFPGLCGLSVLPPEISSSFCYPVNEAEHMTFTAFGVKPTLFSPGELAE